MKTVLNPEINEKNYMPTRDYSELEELMAQYERHAAKMLFEQRRFRRRLNKVRIRILRLMRRKCKSCAGSNL